VLVVAFPFLFSSQLPFELSDGDVDTAICVASAFGNHKDLAVLAPCDYLDAWAVRLTAVEYDVDAVYAVVVLGQLGGLLFGVSLDGLGYLDVFTCD